MQRKKSIAVPAPDELHARLEQARRSDKFPKVPSMAALVRFLIEDGLVRLEGPAPTPEAHP